MFTLSNILLTAAFFIAGITNTIAGGGSFLTFPALLMAGLDPRAANITSTMALFPMQVVSGFWGRKTARGIPALPLRTLAAISLLGGAIGAALLLFTPSSFFARLVPWLILFATGVFAYGSFRKKPNDAAVIHPIDRNWLLLIQLGIAIYGGYFGAGIGFLMLAALTLTGMNMRTAGTTKNILAAAINTSGVLIFAFFHDTDWSKAALGITASIGGSMVGMRLLHRINERILRIAVILIGMTLSIVMFYKSL